MLSRNGLLNTLFYGGNLDTVVAQNVQHQLYVVFAVFHFFFVDHKRGLDGVDTLRQADGHGELKFIFILIN